MKTPIYNEENENFNVYGTSLSKKKPQILKQK
jgi:hypothetical protein